jgi:hypothetical protein
MLIAIAVVAGGVVGAPAVASGSPTQVGPPDAPTTQVTAAVSLSCTTGGGVLDVGFTLTVPSTVRAGRPFPLTVSIDEGQLPVTASDFVSLSVTGATQTEITIDSGATTYLVPTWAPQQRLTITITGFGLFDFNQFIQARCTAPTPAVAASIAVRHATPFAAAQLTAEQAVGIFCLSFPGGRPSGFTSDVGVIVPNQVRVGEPFPIEGGVGVSVSGGTRSGQTVTPTGEVGDTVDFTYNGGFTRIAPPPFPPFPLLTCTQEGGTVHLASVPIVAR